MLYNLTTLSCIDMIIHRSIPLRVYNSQGVPQRLEGVDRKTVKAGQIVTYQIMVQNSITIQASTRLSSAPVQPVC